MEVIVGDDGVTRCWWGADPEIYRSYHDQEWGRPTTDDHLLFEKICLEGFQAGLSWLTILRKREAFREVFAGFDPEQVAGFGDSEVEILLADARIVRHEGKIRSTINNAQAALDVIEDEGSLSDFFWTWAQASDSIPTEIPSVTETSTDLSKELKRRGWTFVGPTTCYAFMQAMGLVNDHLSQCDARDACQDERRSLLSRT